MRFKSYDDLEEARAMADEGPTDTEEEPGICPECSGSGEGCYEGSVCHRCKGKGES